MALLWTDGFDAYGTTVGNTVVGTIQMYGGNENAANFSVRAGRIAQKSIELRSSSGNCSLSTPSLGNIATAVVGFAFQAAFARTNTLIVVFREDGDSTQGMNLLLNTDGSIAVRRNTTTLFTTAANVIVADAWHYIEFKVTVHSSAGAYELKVDGVSLTSASGVNTRGGATNNYFNTIRLQGVSGVVAGRGHWFDDFYICDSSGAVNNDFLGDRRVITIFPDSAGDTTQFTPDSGSNYARVNEQTNGYDSDTSYVEDATTGHRDIYNFDAIANLAVVNGIQQNVICRKTDATDFTIKLTSKTGATVSVGSGINVGSTSYLGKTRIQETDPDTVSAWTDTGLSAAQFGYDVG
jgi:hypothetical protein